MNSSPTALFDSYNNDFQHFIFTIQDKLEGDASNDRAGVSPPMRSLPQLIIINVQVCSEEWTWTWTKRTKWHVPHVEASSTN